jgi:putative membrane protein
MEKMTLKQAIMSSPGPNSLKETLILFVKGLCMGGADIIPGVSGGTIALIAGIYQKLLAAIKSVDIVFLKKLLKFDIKGAIAEVHIRFIVVLFSGIAVAIISLSRLMNFLLKYHPEPTFSLFYGLIAASILVVGREVKWKTAEYISIVAGIVMAYLIVGLIPVSTPTGLWFIFLSGVIGICAMILPGISGAFILLILGKYEFITGTLKSPFSVNEVTGVNNLVIIIVFCLGCASGLAGFSRFLNWLLSKWHSITLAFLTGLMAGSMRKIWPWKGEAVVEIIRGKEHIVSQPNAFPESFGLSFVFCLFLMVLGIAVIIILDRLSRKYS